MQLKREYHIRNGFLIFSVSILNWLEERVNKANYDFDRVSVTIMFDVQFYVKQRKRNPEISTKKSNYLKEWNIVLWNWNEKKGLRLPDKFKKRFNIDNFINHITAKARYFTHVISFLRLTSLSLLFKWQFDISKVQIAEKQLMKTAL